MARDYHLREEVLERSIVKQADGSFRVYLAGADKELKGQEAKNDFGKDEKGFYATVSKADLNKYKNLVTADSDKDYLVLATAAEKFAQTYGIRGDKSTLDGVDQEGVAGLTSLFAGKDVTQANANDPEALADYFKDPKNGIIVFGGNNVSEKRLGKGVGQMVTGEHAYGIVTLGKGNYEVINPWGTKHSMIMTEQQLKGHLREGGVISFLEN